MNPFIQGCGYTRLTKFMQSPTGLARWYNTSSLDYFNCWLKYELKRWYYDLLPEWDIINCAVLTDYQSYMHDTYIESKMNLRQDWVHLIKKQCMMAVKCRVLRSFATIVVPSLWTHLFLYLSFTCKAFTGTCFSHYSAHYQYTGHSMAHIRSDTYIIQASCTGGT